MIKIRPFGGEPTLEGSAPAIRFTCELCGELIVESDAYTLRGKIIQCPQCGRWVCKAKCWDKSLGLCKLCARYTVTERNQRIPEDVMLRIGQIDRKLSQVESYIKDLNKNMIKNMIMNRSIVCPICGSGDVESRHSGGRGNYFVCNKCGCNFWPPLKSKRCLICGATMPEDAQYCGICGNKLKQ